MRNFMHLNQLCVNLALALLASAAFSERTSAMAIQKSRPDSTRTPQVVVPPVTTTGSVSGTVRINGTGGVVSGAKIDVAGGHATAWSNSAGEYALNNMPAGNAELRVSAVGYMPLTLEVIVPANGALRVDITLTALLVAPDLAASKVELRAVRIVAPFEQTTPTTGSTDDTGRWHWTGNPSASTLTSGEPDIFRILADDPHLSMRPDFPPTLMNRGGGGDQTLVLLDGLPVLSPFHAGTALSAITPDAIAGLTLNDGAFSVRYGGRLGGALDISTRRAPRDAPTASAAIGPASSRLMFGTPLKNNTRNGMLLGLRRSNADVFRRTRSAEGHALASYWTDGLASMRLAHKNTSVTLLGFGSEDRLPSNRWNTHTAGLVLRQGDLANEKAVQFETRVWSAGLGADLHQNPSTSAAMLDHAVTHAGVAMQLARAGTIVGTSVESLNMRYHVTIAPSDTSSDPRAPLDLRAKPTILAAFVEQRWGSSATPLEFRAGVRAVGTRGTPTQLGPSASIVVRPTPQISVNAGYARTHQFVQSLRNDASLFGSVIGIDLSVSAGRDGVPVAHSDVATGGLTVQLGPFVRLAFDGYVRSMQGLALVDPKEPTLFATRGFSVGTGRAEGIGVALTGDIARITWQAMYGAGHSTVRTAERKYRPASDPGQSASASIAVQADRRTQFRLAGWASNSRSLARLGQVGNEWAIDDLQNQLDNNWALSTLPLPDSLPLPGGGPLGQPNQAETSQDRPIYLRVDFSVSREWHTGPGPGRLSTFATVANIFNRANVATYVVSGATVGTLKLTPRSLLGGLTWRY